MAAPPPAPADVVSEEVIVVTGTKSETPRVASPVTTEVIDRQRLAESGAQTVAEVDAEPDRVLTAAHLEAAYATSFEVLQGQAGLVVVPLA